MLVNHVFKFDPSRTKWFSIRSSDLVKMDQCAFLISSHVKCMFNEKELLNHVYEINLIMIPKVNDVYQCDFERENLGL